MLDATQFSEEMETAGAGKAEVESNFSAWGKRKEICPTVTASLWPAIDLIGGDLGKKSVLTAEQRKQKEKHDSGKQNEGATSPTR